MYTVLVVEDSSTQREMISELLQKCGLSVATAADGIEALAQMQQVQPDVILLDVVMPRMNGYEVCRQLKANPATQQVPIIMCSSKGEDFDRYWGIKQGADAYITKPFQAKELMSVLKRLLRG
jgi:twitching motility two-component system response regulator PilH